MESAESIRTNYMRSHKKFLILTIGFIICAIAVFLYGISIAQYHVGFKEAYTIIWNEITGNNHYDPYVDYDMWFKHKVVIDMNVPRMIGAITVGATLAVGGAIMQSVIKNPLADPFTTGISSGALLGVSLFLASGFTVIPYATGNLALITNAFVFSLIPTAAIIAVTVFKKHISPTMMILIGLGVMYIFSACSSLVRYNADPESAQEIFTWSLGSIGKITWDNVPLLIGACACLIIFGIVISKTLNSMTAGDNLAKTLGINVKLIRSVGLVAVAIATAVMVSFSGTIGFVGLVCPHIARILVGANNKLVVPCAATVGVLMLMTTDTISKVITTTGLPVGAVTALIGSPIFIYLLVRQKGSSW